MSLEFIIALLSLVWVIGILTLQRQDLIINDFLSSLTYYLSLNDKGVIDKVQLEVKQLLTPKAILRLTEILSNSTTRRDLVGLRKSLSFVRLAEKLQFGFVVFMFAVTMALPFVFLLDFSNISAITFISKDVFSYLCLVTVIVFSLVSEKVLKYYSDKNYPVKFEIDGKESK